MFQKILFDLDGTLTDPKIGITKSAQHALKHYGIEVDANQLTKFIGPPLIDSFMQFYGFSLEQAKEAVTYYRERFAPIGKFENEVYPGIPEMLKRLKEKGAVLAVASSKPELFVKEILEHFELDEYFDVVVGSLMNETRTAKEEVVEEALRQLQEKVPAIYVNQNDAEPVTKTDKSIAMVGDRKFDIIGAKAHGLTAVGVKYGYAEPGELEEENPDYIADTVEELANYLLGNE